MINLIELFGGIGACSKAFKNLGYDINVLDYVEIDKYAVASYNAINNTNFEPQDITTWNKDIENVDLIIGGSPCQDFSLAGKQAGGDEGSGTRSSLMYETMRIVERIKPKYVIWENVKNLLSVKHRHNFDSYIETMEQLGYTNYYQVLNAKDYGIPQNRERVFTISIRKDIDRASFEFPPKQELKLRLKDMLEDEVDKKYYLSDELTKTIKFNGNKKGIIAEVGTGSFEINRRVYGLDDVSWTLRGKAPDQKVLIKTSENIEAKINVVGKTKSGGERSLILDSDGICNCLTSTDYKQPKQILIKNATKQGYLEAIYGDSVNLAYPESNTRRGRVGNQVSQTLQCNDSMGVVVNERN